MIEIEKNFKAVSLGSNNSGHFFFGFHDLVAWNAKGNRILALKSDYILAPPNGSTRIDVGFFEDGTFHKVTDTLAYNYPQGSRQQWVGDSNLFLVNDEINGKWCSKIYDTDKLELVKILNYPTHVLTQNGFAFGLDYARLHRVGGYGYTGLSDATEKINAPDNIGITKENINNDDSCLLVSIKDIANYKMSENDGTNHYITHLLLSPDNNRIAFLHRYKMKDGGETTRLMTIGVDGKGLRCLASGFLSHFDWQSNESILIWGRMNSGVEKFRSSFLYKMIPESLLITGKRMLKQLLKRNKGKNTSTVNSHAWLLVSDTETVSISYFAPEIMTEDGHPMFCPANREWLVCDTYPNEEGIRELYLYNSKTEIKVSLGFYKMIDTCVDLVKSKEALKDISTKVLSAFSFEKMAFYRSGLHCDLHPRWHGKGEFVCFDSIHEGARNMYIINVGDIVNVKVQKL